MVFPDRKPHPALQEVKKAHEFINFKNKGITDGDELRVLVENLYDFINLERFDITAKVKADGQTLKTVSCGNVKVDPHTGKLIRIALDGLAYDSNTEYFVEVSATLKNDWGLLKKGHEIAHEQILLDKKIQWRRPSQEKPNGTVRASTNKAVITISSTDFIITFDKKAGKITSYKFKGMELIKEGSGLVPNFWRAPTDNDIGNQMYKHNIEWKNASLNANVASCKDQINQDGSLNIAVIYSLPGVETTFESVYTIYADGTVKVHNQLNPTNYKADIPRVGMRMQLPRQFNNMTYYGRGPWENYQDRHASAIVDVYESRVSDQYVPYVRPQENGYKTDVRWASFADSQNNGLLVVASGNNGRNISLGAHHVPQEDFDVSAGITYDKQRGKSEVNFSKHINDIVEQDLVELNIDLAQRGVGGDDSWGAKPQEEYMLRGDKVHSYSFYIVPFTAGTKDTHIKRFKELYPD
jgi:beta-galactosidase